MQWKRNFVLVQTECMCVFRPKKRLQPLSLHTSLRSRLDARATCLCLSTKKCQHVFCYSANEIVDFKILHYGCAIKPWIFHYRLTFIKCSFFNLSLRGLSSKRERFNYIYFLLTCIIMLLFGTLSEYHCKIFNEFYLLIAFFSH